MGRPVHIGPTEQRLHYITSCIHKPAQMRTQASFAYQYNMRNAYLGGRAPSTHKHLAQRSNSPLALVFAGETCRFLQSSVGAPSEQGGEWLGYVDSLSSQQECAGANQRF